MDRLKNIPDWESFKSLGRSKLIKSSYWWLFLVPLFAKALEATGDEITFTIFNAAIKITLDLPFSWALFYFTAVCFSIASIIYLTCCPLSINKYEHFEEWEKSGKDSSSLVRAFLSAYRDDKRMAPHAISDGEKDYFLTHYLEYEGDLSSINKNSRTPSRLLKAGIPDGSVKAVYYYVSGRIKRSRALARLSMLVFYSVGFICFAVVLIQNFIYVCKHL